MSELNPDSNEDFDKRFDTIITGQPTDDFLNRLKNFDNMRRDLYVSLIEFAENKEEYSTEQEGETAKINLDGIAEELGGMARAMIAGGHTKEDLVESMSWVIYDDVEERATTMNELLGSENIIVFSQEKYAELIQKIFKDNGLTEAAVDIFEGMYHLELSRDVAKFIHDLIHPDEEASDELVEKIQEITMSKDLREHVLDVGKVVAGVAIAAALGKLIRWKRS